MRCHGCQLGALRLSRDLAYPAEPAHCRADLGMPFGLDRSGLHQPTNQPAGGHGWLYWGLRIYLAGLE